MRATVTNQLFCDDGVVILSNYAAPDHILTGREMRDVWSRLYLFSSQGRTPDFRTPPE
jgi:sulfur relay (sulfurtransferase) DsrF/TusC family protein